MLVDRDGKRMVAGATLIPELSKNPTTVEIHNDCDGSPQCAVELRISRTDKVTGTERYIELHMTEKETEFLEKWLKAARQKVAPFQLPFPGTVLNPTAGLLGMIVLDVPTRSNTGNSFVGDAKKESTVGLARHTDGRSMRFTYKYDGRHIASFDEETLYLMNKWGGVNDLLSFFDDYSGVDPNKMQIVVDWI